MSEIAVKIIPESPFKLDIFDFSEFPVFEKSSEGIEAFKQHKRSIRNGILFYIVLWGSLFFYIRYLYLTNHPIKAVIVFLVGIVIVGGMHSASTFIQDADSKLQEARSQHCWNIAQFISDKYIKNSTWFSWLTEAFIYNDNMCAYISTKNREFVVYSKSNIKEISRERVLVSTFTTTHGTAHGTGTSRSGLINDYNNNYSSNIYSNSYTSVNYEWHFDIFTNYMPYPKISMVIPDGKFAEDSIGRAYSVLKP